MELIISHLHFIDEGTGHNFPKTTQLVSHKAGFEPEQSDSNVPAASWSSLEESK